jgi:YD repeat-containing protein
LRKNTDTVCKFRINREIAKHTYDNVVNRTKTTDALNHATTYTYDVLNRRKTDTNSLGKPRSYSYDAVGHLSTTNDPDAKYTYTVDRNGRKRTYDYDALYRQTAEHWLDTNNTDIRTITYSYDAVGHLILNVKGFGFFRAFGESGRSIDSREKMRLSVT